MPATKFYLDETGHPVWEVDGVKFNLVQTRVHPTVKPVNPPSPLASLIQLRAQVTELTNTVNIMLGILREQGLMS